ncbi:MAG: hypothetical protein DMG37_07685 [Acidobacteria bacterium]|nr:MAG: hypothetical protein DMG37_07685 [Acidobacteriota bacterium]
MKMKSRTNVAAALTFALAGAVIAFAQQQSFNGVVTDSMCGAAHMAKDKTPAECTRMCVKDGMKYALAADKKLYTLEGHEAELSKLAGQRVTVKGTLKGNTLSVQEVAASK